MRVVIAGAPSAGARRARAPRSSARRRRRRSRDTIAQALAGRRRRAALIALADGFGDDGARRPRCAATEPAAVVVRGFSAARRSRWPRCCAAQDVPRPPAAQAPSAARRSSPTRRRCSTPRSTCARRSTRSPRVSGPAAGRPLPRRRRRRRRGAARRVRGRRPGSSSGCCARCRAATTVDVDGDDPVARVVRTGRAEVRRRRAGRGVFGGGRRARRPPCPRARDARPARRRAAARSACSRSATLDPDRALRRRASSTLAEDLARRAALALDNALLYRAAERARARPAGEPAARPPARASTASSSAPRSGPAGDGTEIGGDFYDAFPRATARSTLAIGDVTGKGARGRRADRR